jgi:hypothetical protein
MPQQLEKRNTKLSKPAQRNLTREAEWDSGFTDLAQEGANHRVTDIHAGGG